MTLILSEMALAQDLQQTLSVIESDGAGGETTKIASIECVVYPGTDANTEFGTALTLENKAWTVLPLIPNETLEEGDVFVLPSGEKLNVRRVNHISGDTTGSVQWCLCEQLQ